jgi:hypothetical protein
MANEKKPSIYYDRSTIGSQDELDEYGVWVKSEPQDLSSAGAQAAAESVDFGLPDMEELPDMDIKDDFALSDDLSFDEPESEGSGSEESDISDDHSHSCLFLKICLAIPRGAIHRCILMPFTIISHISLDFPRQLKF